MQKPSVGRIVIYKIEGSLIGQDGECAAVVTRVWSDTCVNLRLLPDHDQVRTVQSLQQGETPTSVLYDELKNDRTWRWPDRV